MDDFTGFPPELSRHWHRTTLEHLHEEARLNGTGTYEVITADGVRFGIVWCVCDPDQVREMIQILAVPTEGPDEDWFNITLADSLMMAGAAGGRAIHVLRRSSPEALILTACGPESAASLWDVMFG